MMLQEKEKNKPFQSFSAPVIVTHVKVDFLLFVSFCKLFYIARKLRTKNLDSKIKEKRLCFLASHKGGRLGLCSLTKRFYVQLWEKLSTDRGYKKKKSGRKDEHKIRAVSPPAVKQK